MNRQIVEEAAAWLVDFSAGTDDRAARAAFDTWLRKSPEHVRAYLELLPVWEDGAQPLPSDGSDPAALIARARASDNVLALNRRGDDQFLSALAPRRRRLAFAASIAATLLIGGVLAWMVTFRVPAYTTEVGEQRTVRLADGSTVQLNTRSRVRVKFTDDSRELELLAGQALFNVARDPTRPFVVSSGITRMRAVGTRFDVHLRDGATVVTVLEGRVVVSDEAAGKADRWLSASRAVELSAGERITVGPQVQPAVVQADLASAAAWTQGRLVFDAAPLSEVVAEFNRYNAATIVVDEALREFRISGSFGSSDPQALLEFLRTQTGILIDEAPAGIRITRR